MYYYYYYYYYYVHCFNFEHTLEQPLPRALPTFVWRLQCGGSRGYARTTAGVFGPLPAWSLFCLPIAALCLVS